MGADVGTSVYRDKLVIKAVRNIRKGGQKENIENGMYRPEIRLDLQRSRLLTEAYRQTEGQPMVLRRARGLERILNGMDLYIQDWEKIVGSNVSSPENIFFGIDMNWRSVRRTVDEDEARTLLDRDGRRELDEMIAYWKGRSMSDIQQNMFSGPVLDYWKMNKGSPATWSHWSELGIPDYEKVFRVGLKGIIGEARDRLEEIDRTVPPDYIEQKEFLQAVVISLEAAVGYARRYAALARRKAAGAATPADISRYETIARICSRVPEHPPETLAEAIQSFFFIHAIRSLEFSTLGIGVRFDKVFGPFYEDDLKNGRITREEALDLLQLLWVKFHELGLIYSPTLSAIYGGVNSLQGITLGGVDARGRDVTNEMTYLVLETARLMQSPEPTIALRCHEGTPRELLSKALDVVRTGIGYPSFFNDRAILPMLDAWDVPPEHAMDYAVSGCVYIELPGKNISHRAIGGVVLPGMLFYALHRGIHPLTGEQVGAGTPDPLCFQSAEEVMDAYLEQVRFCFKRLCTIENTAHRLYEKYLPRPFYSALLEGCIERGRDTKSWAYPSAVNNMCVVLGPTNVSDAIAAIKKNVFEERKITMAELIEAMNADWVGYDDIRRLMISAPKYGNDDDYADGIAAEVQHRTAKAMMQSKNRFGYPCRGDGSGISATYSAGSVLPATPDGRRFGDPLADGTLSPVFGMDRKGPTAVLKSASKIDAAKSHNHLLNQKFSPSALEGGMKETFIDYLRSWGDLNISQVQFNVVSRETLIAAQNNPEEHADLLVRVAGYSAYFVDLSKGLQDSIIARTEHVW